MPLAKHVSPWGYTTRHMAGKYRSRAVQRGNQAELDEGVTGQQKVRATTLVSIVETSADG